MRADEGGTVLDLRGKMFVLIFGMVLLLTPSLVARASQLNVVSFTHGYIWGSLEFPEEAYPSSTITCNLTVGAYVDVNIYNLTVEISSLTGENWQILSTEPILSYYMAQSANLTRQIMVTLPQNTSGRLHYDIVASTDKGFGETDFYATYVRTLTYDALSSLYGGLLTNYSMLRADYDGLLINYSALNAAYTSLAAEFNAMQAGYNSLNSRYEILIANNTMLNSSYDSLQEHYDLTEARYDASTGELNIVRNLMYVLGVTTVIFVAATIYFRRKAPYIVVRKETAVQPENEKQQTAKRASQNEVSIYTIGVHPSSPCLN